MTLLEDLLIIGFQDGSILVSEITMTEVTLQLTWNPIKMIQPRKKKRSKGRMLEYVSMLHLERDMDILLVGNAHTRLRLVNNFSQCFNHESVSQIN